MRCQTGTLPYGAHGLRWIDFRGAHAFEKLYVEVRLHTGGDVHLVVRNGEEGDWSDGLIADAFAPIEQQEEATAWLLAVILARSE